MNYYKPISVMEQKMPENPPLYDSDSGISTEIPTPDTAYDRLFTDTELVKALYSQINSMLYPFIVEVIDRYDYNNSPIYDEDGISRETLAQLVSQVLDMAAEQLDEIDEIRLEVNARQIIVGWNRSGLLNAAVEALILNNIFMHRRPRRNRIYSSYSFKDGKYNGLNYS